MKEIHEDEESVEYSQAPSEYLLPPTASRSSAQPEPKIPRLEEIHVSPPERRKFPSKHVQEN